MATHLDAATERELAVAARCDPRTIRKVYLGRPVKGLAFKRAAAVLHAAGYHVPALAAPAATEGEVR